VGSAATEYEGGSGSDTIRVVFTPDQLNEILNNVSQQNALRTFLTTPSSDLNLDASSWNAIVDNFETANLGIAAPRETSGQDNYVNLDTWDPLPTAVAVGAGTGGNNLIVGTAAGQTLDGLGGNDVLAAFHTAANTLNGGSGSDLLLGGDGADILGGGDGMDILAGGKGADTFRASSTPGDANEDMLVDYGFAEGDTLDLSALLDSVFDVGDNVNNFIQVETVNTNDLVLRVDQTGTGNFGGKDVFLLAGAATNSGDPLRVFFDGTNHVVTG
jgi:Ca2+-binding RTX toxin-like protein